MESDTIKVVAGAVGTAIASAIVAGGAVTMNDVSGARAFKDAKVEELLAAEKMKQELAALRAQQQMLLRMLDGATLSLDSIEVPVVGFIHEVPTSALEALDE